MGNSIEQFDYTDFGKKPNRKGYILRYNNLEIILCNRIETWQWPNDLIEKIFNKTKERFKELNNPIKVLLVFHEQGFKGTKGVAFCNKLQKYVNGTEDDPERRKCFHFALCGKYFPAPASDWEYAVIIPKKTADYAKDFPAIFASILFHEFEHVHLYHKNFQLFAINSSFLYDGMESKEICNEMGKTIESKYCFPIEQYCDAVAKRSTMELYNNLEEHLDKLIEGTNGKDYWEHIKKVSPDFADKSEFDLYHDVLNFCSPYKGLYKDFYDTERQCNSIAKDHIADFESIWKVNNETI